MWEQRGFCGVGLPWRVHGYGTVWAGLRRATREPRRATARSSKSVTTDWRPAAQTTKFSGLGPPHHFSCVLSRS